jgi:peptidoglycan hydrolase CwlO-like protein
MEPLTWAGVVMATIALIDAGHRRYTDRQAKKDELANGTEITTLKADSQVKQAQIEAISSQLAVTMRGQEQCQEDHSATKAELKDCHERHQITDRRIAALEQIHAGGQR